MSEVSSTTLEFASFPVSCSTLVRSGIRLLAMLSTYENPFLWSFWLGKRNKQADVEGPFYILDSPDRRIEKGKAILAPVSLLKKFRPFLMTVRVLSLDGSPLPGAVLDWWQADTSGSYYFSTYTLRGRIVTDDQGYAEVLTVAPGAYGVAGGMRAAHFHMWVHAPPAPPGGMRAAHFHMWVHAPPAPPGTVGYDDLTTQMYVCEANDIQLIRSDFVNYMRKTREGNMVQAWSVPDKDVDEGRPYKDFPVLPSNDEVTRKRIEWWNSKLGQMSEPGLKIAAGATAEFRLNAKTGWF